MSETQKLRIIAEAGINHNGDLALAKELVDVADSAGADFVKFQSFIAKNLVSANTQQAEYQAKNNNSNEPQLEMLRKYELSFNEQIELFEYCATKNVAFLTTPFDSESLGFIHKTLDLSTVKISSGDLTNLPFLAEIATKFNDIILSTGMGTLADIEDAVSTIVFTKAYGRHPTDYSEISSVWSDNAALPFLDDITLLHCTTNYPAQVDEINLLAMNTLGQSFGTKIGYSDHTAGNHVSIAATALGARVIEKHFTLDRSMEGPDHRASLEPDELHSLVKQIRDTEKALGSHMKLISPTEKANAAVARKRIVASCDIAEGQIFSAENTSIKRTGEGRRPSAYWGLLGKTAKRSYNVGQGIIE